MPSLRPCDACSRHVFATETKCPFCDALLPGVPLGRGPAIRAGMSRAQRFAVAAAVAGQTLAGCSDNPKGGGLGGGAGTTAAAGTTAGSSGSGGSSATAGTGAIGGGTGGNRVTPVYGAPIVPIGSAGKSSGAGKGSSGSGGSGPIAMPVYGAPFPLDAGTVDDDDAGGVVKKDGGPRIQPLYGAPIPLYGASPPKK